MDDTEIRYILRQNEGETLEFKRFEKLEKINDKTKKDLVKLFVALANNKGGRILFGVTDDRKFDDYKLTEEKYKEFKQKLIQIADSNCNPPIYLNDIQQINVDDHIILLVDVPSGKNLPHAFEGNFYIRIQDQNIKITDPNKIEELIEQKRGINQEIVVEKEEGKSIEHFSTIINEYLNLIIKEENIIIHDDIELDICEVYTKLSAKLPDKKILPITVKFNETENKREKESGVFELVEKEKKLIISGVSGSGKTITLKWLNLTFAEKYLREDDCNIPLYVGLNTYKSGDFYNYIRIKIKEKGVSESTLKLLLKGKLIFLIDGLDLLSSTEDFKPYTEIDNFISEYSECRYVISSRPGFYEEIQNKFKICIIEELDLPKIRLFINNYIDDEKLSNAVAEKILNNKKFKSLFSNPMMLYIAIIVIKSRLDGKIKIDKILPSKRSELYNNFISELFMRHKREGKSFITDKRQILKVITNLYFKLQCKNWVDCEYEYAIEIALEHSFDKNQISAKYILDDLFKIGLLKKEESLQGDYIKYGIHQSFQEYFAALKLKECFEKNYDLSPVFKHPKWEDVVIFASEMFDSPDEFIFKIIDNHELDLASKCVQNATKKIKENLCINLADKIDNRYISEKTDAVKSLGRLGDIGISLINEVLNHENRYVRRGAADALGKIESDKAVNGLLKALADKDPSVQTSASSALGEIKSDKAVDGLIKALADKDPSVQTSASSALGEIKSDKAVDGLIKALATEEYEVQMSASYALKKIKSDKAVDGLIKALAHEDFRVRRGAASILGKIKSDKAVDGLLKALADEEYEVQMSAAYALGEIKSDKAVDSLIKALADKDPSTGWSASSALGKINSESAVEPLIKALNHENTDVRNRAADALEKMKSESVVEPLIKALNHENTDMRRGVAYALEKINSESAVEPLIKALNHEIGYVRRRAADALGEIITLQNRHLLEPLLGSENEFIAKISSDILKKINENERSKQKIILEKIPTSEKDEPSRLDNLQKPCGEPAEKGLQDPYIGSFIDRLKSIKKPTTIVDYGCGQGKLLCALTTLPDVAINNISYFGVDEKTRCRYISRLTSEKYGLTKSLKKYPEFLKPKNFYLKDIRLDYALLMHALHEIELRDLIEIIYSISSKLNIAGQIFILDQRELIEKERNFVLWNDVEYFEMLFSDSGFEHSPRFFNTGSNKKLSSVEAIKIKEGCFSKENTAKNCLTVYYSKKKRISNSLKKNNIDYEDYQNSSILYSNISNQIDDYYDFLKLDDNDLYFILREFFKKSE